MYLATLLAYLPAYLPTYYLELLAQSQQLSPLLLLAHLHLPPARKH